MKGGEWYIATMHCIQFMAQERLWIKSPATTLPQFWKISLSSFLRLHFSSFFLLLSLSQFLPLTFTFTFSSSHFHFKFFTFTHSLSKRIILPEFWKISLSFCALTFPVSSSYFHFKLFTFTFKTDYIARVLEIFLIFLFALSVSQFLLLTFTFFSTFFSPTRLDYHSIGRRNFFSNMDRQV